MPDYGWAYINLNVLQSNLGTTGSVCFKVNDTTISGTSAFIYATASHKVGIGINPPGNPVARVLPAYQLDVSASAGEATAARFIGDVIVSGNLSADQIIAATIVSSSHLVVSDNVIGLGLGSSSAETGSVGDRGFILGLAGNNNQAIIWDQSSGSFVIGKVGAQGPERTSFDIPDTNLSTVKAGAITGSVGLSGSIGLFGSLTVRDNTVANVAGTPSNNQVATFADADTIQGEGNLTFDGSTLTVAGAITGSSTLRVHGNVTASHTLFVEQATNRVGINASPPLGDLHVKSSGGDALFIKSGGVTVGSADDPNAQLYVNAENNKMLQVRYSGGGGQECLFVSGSGKVGVNTTAPEHTLSVTGTLGVRDSITGSSTLTIAGAITGSSTLTIGGDTLLSNQTMFIDASANRVGISTTVPEHTLSVTGTLGVSSNATVSGDLQVVGALYGGSPLSISGSSPSAGALEVTGSTTMSGSGDVLIVTGSISVSGSSPAITLTSGDLIVSAGDVYVASKIIHDGDTDTFINFTDDDINFQAGGVNFLDLTEDDSQDEVTFNEGGVDIDFRVETADESHMLFIEGSSNRMSIGDSTNSPAATLEITNHASAGATGVPLVQLNNNDTDKQCLDINAGNIDANVVNITANDVTTARVLAIGADGLTTGNALYVDDNSGDTGTRNTALIIQNHTGAINAKALAIQSDGGVTGVKLDKNYSDTAEASVVGLDIDWDKTGASTTNNTMFGIQLDMDNTTATNGNNTMTGLQVTPTLTHAADAGTPKVKGAVITATGGTNGTSTATGMELTATGADTNEGLVINCADGGKDLKIVSSADTGDFFQIETTTHGATTITTVDDDATAADLTFTIDGDITLDPAGGDVFVDGNVSGSAILRIHGDITGSDTLYVERATNRVGVNASPPLGELHVRSDGSDALFVKQGNVSIGSTDTNAQLYVNAQNDNMFQVRHSGGGGTECFFVSGSGKVGLGTTSPNSLLDVRGDISASSTLKTDGDTVLSKDTVFIKASNNRIAINHDDPKATIHLSESKAHPQPLAVPMLRIDHPGDANKLLQQSMFVVTGGVPDDFFEGRVGINTSDPNGVLHVKSKEGTETIFADGGKVCIGNNNASSKFQVYSSDQKNILRITNALDSDNPTNVFYVSGSNDGLGGRFGSDVTGSHFNVSGSTTLTNVSLKGFTGGYTGSISDGAYNVKDTDYILGVSTVSNTVQINLPAVAGTAGRVLIIKDIGGNANNNNITIDANSSETIDSATNKTISAASGSMTIFSNGAGWSIIGVTT